MLAFNSAVNLTRMATLYTFMVHTSDRSCCSAVHPRWSLTFSPGREEARGLWNVVTSEDCRFCCPAPSTRSTTSIAVAIGPSGRGNAAGIRSGRDSMTDEPSLLHIACSARGGLPGGAFASPTLITAQDQHSSQISSDCKYGALGTKNTDSPPKKTTNR